MQSHFFLRSKEPGKLTDLLKTSTPHEFLNKQIQKSDLNRVFFTIRLLQIV